jgi:folate-dependent phosphoribosylglycinamide formyltransferase PurN
MRVFILTDSEDRHYYFCNKIIEHNNDVVGVITNAKHIKKIPHPEYTSQTKISGILKRKDRVSFLKKKMLSRTYWLKNKILNKLFRKYGKKLAQEKYLAEKKYFEGAKEYFHKHYSHLIIARVSETSGSVNDDEYVSLIRKKQPDIIVVMGTCLISKKIISLADYVLNMHTGLSPYYRGGHTNLWPIVKKDYGYFGVTVHLMTPGIDSGDIIYTRQPDIDREDNYGTINSKCIILGTDLMVRALALITNGQLDSKKQWTKGKLFLKKHWNNYIAYKYFKRKDRFLLKHSWLLENDKLPKVKLITNGIEA